MNHFSRASILLVLFLSCCGLAEAQNQPQRGLSRELGVKLDQQMMQLAGKGFSGVLLVAKDGDVILNKGYGSANRETKTPYGPETIFDIGSITKQFTGAAILKLEMQGKLRTTDPLGKHLKGVPTDKAGITLHNLLTHTAGLVDGLGSDYERLTRDELILRGLAAPLQSPPGVKHEYSNLGYSFLAAVVEQVTGKSYERYLHDNLFKPAGMKKTGYVLPKWDRRDLAVGYGKDGTPWGTPLDQVWDADGPYWNLRGNGGILSTAGDLHKWHLALKGEKILSERAKAKYFASHVPESPRAVSFYGYGWVSQKTSRGTRLVSHDGGNRYFYALFRRYVDEDVVLIVATNTAEPAFMKDLAAIPATIFGPTPTADK